MKRTRSGDPCIQCPRNEREAILRKLQTIVSPVLYEDLRIKPTRDLLRLLDALRHTVPGL